VGEHGQGDVAVPADVAPDLVEWTDRAEQFRGLMTGPTGAAASTQTYCDQLANVWFDLAGNPFPDQVPALTDVVSESRLLYGSDYCFTPEFAVAEQLASLDEAPRRPLRRAGAPSRR